MRHVAGSLLCVFGLAGCAAPPAPYGNFVREVPTGYDRTVVEDGVRQLAAVYPPANTRFELQQATPDAFGKLLTTSLRAKGYAVRESGASPIAQGPAVREEAGAATAALALPLRYVLDQASGLYRITLHVGSQSLTRAYLAQNGVLQPAGAWVRKE